MSELTATQRKREAERRANSLLLAQVLAHYGEVCICCATTEQLGVDHVNGDGRAQRIALFGRNTVSAPFWRWLIAQGFPDDIQTMCRPCNSSKGNGDRCRLDHTERDRELRNRAARQEQLAVAQAVWRQRHGQSRHVSIEPDAVGGRILAYLAEHRTARVGDIAAALEITYNSAAVNLSGLALAGWVVRPTQGVYALPGRETRCEVSATAPEECSDGPPERVTVPLGTGAAEVTACPRHADWLRSSPAPET